jgi:hypothetical protein
MSNDESALGSSLGISSFGIYALALFRSVAAAGLLATFDTQCVERSADDLIADARQVADSAAAHQHDAVFLQRVAFAGDVDGHFFAVGQPHPGNFSQGGVWLLGRHRANLQTNASLLRALIEHRRLAELALLPAVLLDELINCGHVGVLYSCVSRD